MSKSLARGTKLGWFRGLYRYYKDPSASPLGKLIVFLAAIYVVLPVDLVPDVPFIGWLDDIGVMGLATMWLGRMASKYRQAAEPDGPEMPSRGDSRGEQFSR